MAEIYSELPSPELGELTDQAQAILEGAPIFGLRSTLYAYQKRSVAAMLHKEFYLQSIPDPAYIQVRGVGPGGQMFYLQPATQELLGQCPRTSTVRGGVLCEELGKACPQFSLFSSIHWTRNRENRDDSIVDFINGRPAPSSP